MLNTDTPLKFPVPFANSAGGSYSRPIPTSSQIGVHNGYASLPDGFPPLNFVPTGSGGVPVYGQDLNGILNQVSAWARWQAAGAGAVYDSTFATQIGGYPQGAVLQSSGLSGLLWFNQVDSNTSNPDAGGANWLPFTLGSLYAVSTGGSGNTLVAAIAGFPLSYQAGQVAHIKCNATNTGAATLNVNGLGAQPVTCAGAVLTGGTLVSGQVYTFIFDGAAWQAQTTPVVTSTHNFTTTGMWELSAGGAMRQSGQVRAFFSGEGTASFSFPTSFPNACVAIQCTAVNPGASNQRDTTIQVVSRTLTGFTVYYQNNGGSAANNDGFDFTADGY